MSNDTNTEATDDWPPWRKFFMDILKTLIAFLLVSAISITWFDRFDTRLQLNKHIVQTQITRDFELVDTFSATSFAYPDVASDAFNDAAQGMDRKASDGFAGSSLIRRFQDEMFDDYNKATQDIDRRFLTVDDPSVTEKELASAIEALRKDTKDIHTLMKQAIVVARSIADTETKNADLDSLKTELETLRTDSKTARDKFRATRLRILTLFETVISQRVDSLAEGV